jgi:hypothetical protein
MSRNFSDRKLSRADTKNGFDHYTQETSAHRRFARFTLATSRDVLKFSVGLVLIREYNAVFTASLDIVSKQRKSPSYSLKDC